MEISIPGRRKVEMSNKLLQNFCYNFFEIGELRGEREIQQGVNTFFVAVWSRDSEGCNSEDVISVFFWLIATSY